MIHHSFDDLEQHLMHIVSTDIASSQLHVKDIPEVVTRYAMELSEMDQLTICRYLRHAAMLNGYRFKGDIKEDALIRVLFAHGKYEPGCSVTPQLPSSSGEADHQQP